MNPYKENKSGNIIRRTFSKDVQNEELVWHRDKSDRIVLVLEETDWMVQFDNELPKKLNVNEEYFIPKNTFHRVMKGSNDLVVEIIETEFEPDEYEIVETYDILGEGKKKKKKKKKDACYYKVRSRYSVWPSAYGSGALVKCRKVGAKNWGNKTNENEENLEEKWSEKYKKSIDCNNPKGFSQRAHCQGRLKENLEELNISQEEINQILKGYIEAALWTEEERLKYEYNEQYPSLSDDDEFDEDETDEEKELQKIIKVSANLNKKSFNQFTNQDIEPDSLIRAYKDIKKFLKMVGNKIQEAIDEFGLEKVGHDIWLTRNRHGAGFRDNWYEYEDDYVKAAHSLGEVNLYINDSLKLSFDNEHVIDEAKKTDFSKEKEQGLHGWFARQGGKGKSKGWVDCNTCKKDPETGRKKCKTCGRKEGEQRSKYPACRPTPSACSTRGKGKKWGKKSKSKTNENLNIIVKKSIFEENLLNNILNETFKQDEDMRNVEPSVKPQPTVVPQTEPDKKPSRREIFKPIRETKPKPKAQND